MKKIIGLRMNYHASRLTIPPTIIPCPCGFSLLHLTFAYNTTLSLSQVFYVPQMYIKGAYFEFLWLDGILSLPILKSRLPAELTKLQAPGLWLQRQSCVESCI